MTDYSKTTGDPALDSILGLVVVVGFCVFAYKALYSSESADSYDSSDATTDCMRFHIDKGTEVEIFGHTSTEVKKDGWFVVIESEHDGYRNCKVSTSGNVSSTN